MVNSEHYIIQRIYNISSTFFMYQNILIYFKKYISPSLDFFVNAFCLIFWVTKLTYMNRMLENRLREHRTQGMLFFNIKKSVVQLSYHWPTKVNFCFQSV